MVSGRKSLIARPYLRLRRSRRFLARAVCLDGSKAKECMRVDNFAGERQCVANSWRSSTLEESVRWTNQNPLPPHDDRNSLRDTLHHLRKSFSSVSKGLGSFVDKLIGIICGAYVALIVSEKHANSLDGMTFGEFPRPFEMPPICA